MCIIFIKGLTCIREKENFTIDDNATDIYVICNKKLLRRSLDSYLYIYSLLHFVELENIKELYITFFKHQPYMMDESTRNVFKIHRERFNYKFLVYS